MGSNFLVAAFVPSMAFIVSSYIALQPIIPKSFQYKSGTYAFLVQTSLILVLFATILGFTLYTISTYVYKAFEGYVFVLRMKTGLRRSFLKRQTIRFKKIVLQKRIVKQQLDRVEQKIKKEQRDSATSKWRNKRLNRLIDKQKSLEEQKYYLTSDLDSNFPSSERLIMPTRFGNVLRAAEMYPERYGIDAVPIWSRLVSAMPSQDGMMEKINEANNQCQFLLNGALLGVLFSGGCLVVAIYESVCWLYKNSSGNAIDHGIFALIYLVLMVISLGIARFFYEATLFNVSQFGSMIRTSYDLYRLNLLDALHIELPKTLNEERRLWLKISHFMTGNMDYVGDESYFDDSMDFKYTHPIKKSSS